MFKKNQLLVFLLWCSLSFGQYSFVEGYIVTNDGKKTTCYIRNDWATNPAEIKYKSSLDDVNESIGSVQNLQEFSIGEEEVYKRFNVNIERSSIDMKQISANKYPEYKKETLFLKSLVYGEANLYVYKETNLTKFFFEKKDVPITQLIYIKYSVGNFNIAENNQFRQQLLNHVTNASANTKDVSNIRYFASELIAHFNKYNGSIAPQGIALKNSPKPRKKAKFSIRITPGMNVASMSIAAPGTFDFDKINTTIGGQYIPKLGAEFEITLPFKSESWSLFANPSYEHFDAEKNFSVNTRYPGQVSMHHASASYTLFEVAFGFRYRYFIKNSPNNSIFFNVAYVANVSDDLKIEIDEKEVPPSQDDSSLSIGVGYAYRRFSLECRMTGSKKFVISYLSEAEYKSSGLILGYRIL